ncbi:MAG: carboxymuconolactone decarboxylase family protein [Alphaproteobacteria bacterium]
MTYFPSMPDASLIHFMRRYPQYAEPLHHFVEAALRAPNGELSPAEREMIFAYVSGLNGCQFCHAAHTGVAEEMGYPKGEISNLLEDSGLAGASAKMRPILEYAAKLTEDPTSVGKGDIQAVLDAGWSEDTMMNVVMICGAANLFNRWIEGCGVKANPQHVNAGIKALAQGGYLDIMEAAKA